MSLRHTGTKAGVAACALGVGLFLSPTVGIATADSPDSGATTASATASEQSTSTPAPDQSASTAAPGRAKGRSARATTSAPPAGVAEPTAASGLRLGALRTRAGAVPRAQAGTAQPRLDSNIQTAPTDFNARPPTAETTSATNEFAATDASAAAQIIQVVADDPGLPPVSTTAARMTTLTVPAVGYRISTANLASGIFGSFQAFIDGIVLLIRRTFFNEAPTVAPQQTSGQSVRPITGTIGAIDQEDDPLTYKVDELPEFGTVVVNSSGQYTYTPGSNFAGTDQFTVAVTDAGLHFNLLDFGRPSSTIAVVTVTGTATGGGGGGGTPTGKITFSFTYGTGSRYWTNEAKAALEATANYLAGYFVTSAPVTITYKVTGEKASSSSTLASAGSDLITSGAGFYPTVVQKKILTGVDANGSAADGEIEVNFGNNWAYGSSVGFSQYDFRSTLLHELMHTVGFLSYIDSAGNNTGNEWTTFDSFVVTASGADPIKSNYTWNTAYNTNLTGGAGGLYFGGPNAEAAYGGPVPLYTPRPWEDGSSVSHLDDSTFTGSKTQLMNAVADSGKGVRTLSAIDIGILKDLGYTITSQPAVLFIFLFLRRRKNAARTSTNAA